MNRFRAYWPLDDAPQRDGDAAWRGVNERLHPQILPAGYAARGKNVRFTEGDIVPRLGIGILRCGKTDGVTAFGEVYGAIEFYDSTDGQTWIVIAADSGVWKTRPNNVAVSVDLPDGVTLSATTFKQFVVCKSVLVMLRGPDNAPLACTQLSEGFKSITQTATGDGTEEIPNSSFGIYFANRLIVIYDRDKIAVSDDGDYTRYTIALQSFQINEGDNDELVALAAFDENTLLFFKTRSVWKVTNIGADITLAVGPLEVTRQYGCLAPLSVARAGRDVYWWSQQGLVSVGLTDQNELSTATNALTDDLPVTLARINPLHLANIRVAYHDGFIYCAVPLDDARILGPNLVQGGATTPLFYETIAGLTVDASYVYGHGSNETFSTASETGGYLTDGSTVYYGPVTFEAQNTSVTVTHADDTIGSTATLQRVLNTGVNTGVLVYDTRQQAWAGVDEGTAIRVHQWFTTTILGAERLCFLATDGWLRLYDDDYEDEITATVATPYVDLIVETLPVAGNTVRVNGGTLATVNTSATNTASTWGVHTAGNTVWARRNLWADLSDNGGYKPTATSPWTAPNATPSQIDDGVRFTATDGNLPTVTVVGAWAFTDAHSGTEIQRTPIETLVRTRAYRFGEAGRKRAQRASLQCSTWNPTYTVQSIVDGVNETATPISAKTRSRTTYTTAGSPAWDASNASDDHGAAYRQDYSVVLPATGMQLGSTGVNFEQHQDITETVDTPARGEWLQLEITNTTGRLKVRGVDLEAIASERRTGTYA